MSREWTQDEIDDAMLDDDEEDDPTVFVEAMMTATAYADGLKDFTTAAKEAAS